MPVTDRITLEKKYQKLQEILRSLESVAVAFSGGVDSTFLLKVAQETLGDKAIAITACPCSFTERERKETEDFCRENHIHQEICKLNEFEIPGFRQNPPDRCYICKKGIFTRLWEVAKKNNINVLAEGSNRAAYDVCVSRAVANLSTLSEYCLPFVKIDRKSVV